MYFYFMIEIHNSPIKVSYFIPYFQEWQEFLDRAFSILIPQVLDQSLDARINNEGEKGRCMKSHLI